MWVSRILVIQLCILELSDIARAATTSTAALTDSSEEPAGEDENALVENVQTIEEIMDANITTSNIPDVEADEDTVEAESLWDANLVVRDVAYFIRAHKFHDYDRRYYTNVDDAPNRLYEMFPRPKLRALHWDVRRHCEVSLEECLKYLDKIVKLTALRREDDTVTVMRERKWSRENNTEQIEAAQRDCLMAQRRDNLTVTPFQGPIERFQWRTTVSYYMCWYTMLGEPELAIFGEPCDNQANCFELVDEDGEARNRDPRANDDVPYACALYSFCPDHCCPVKHVRDARYCHQSPRNPCHAGNPPENRECRLNREENRDFHALITNRINVSCDCQEPGYEWSSTYGLCVDVNECTRGLNDCAGPDRTCVNLPGYFDCACRHGLIYDPEMKSCQPDRSLDVALRMANAPRFNSTKPDGLFESIAMTFGKSTGCPVTTDILVVMPIFLLVKFP